MERTKQLIDEALEAFDRVKVPGEEWRLTASFWNFAVSDQGRVLRYNQTPNRYTGRLGWELEVLEITQKYLRCSGGMFLHTLVADAFIGPRPVSDKAKYVIDHIDENKLNNHPSNLRYLTSAENTLRSQSSEVRSQQLKTRWAKMTPEMRSEYNKKTALVRKMKAEGTLPEGYHTPRVKVSRAKKIPRIPKIRIAPEIPWEKMLKPVSKGVIMVLRDAFRKDKRVFVVQTSAGSYKFVQFHEGASAIDISEQIFETMAGSKFSISRPRHPGRKIVEGKSVFKEAELGDTRLAELFGALSIEVYAGAEGKIEWELL